MTQARHSHTGVVERHIRLLRITMRKLHADLSEVGIAPSPRTIYWESLAAHNSLLTFGGVIPNQGVLGITPRDYFDMGDATPALEKPTTLAGAAEEAMLIRHQSRGPALKTVAGYRLSLANRSSTQQLYLGQIHPGVLVDI